MRFNEAPGNQRRRRRSGQGRGPRTSGPHHFDEKAPCWAAATVTGGDLDGELGVLGRVVRALPLTIPRLPS